MENSKYSLFAIMGTVTVDEKVVNETVYVICKTIDEVNGKATAFLQKKYPTGQITLGTAIMGSRIDVVSVDPTDLTQ